MLIPADKNRTDCFYCQDITKEEKTYPLRKGKYSSEGLVNRCLWHSKFQCSECKSYFHFSFLYWCPTENKIICGKCNRPTLYPVKFWNKTYAYAFDCKDCGETHYDLLYAEFIGDHPWQVNKKILNKEENILLPIIQVHHPWDPIWKPAEQRSGEEISLEEAMKIDNSVHALYKQLSSVVFHSDLTPDEDVDLSDTAEKWDKTSQIWIQHYADTMKDKGDVNREFIIDPALWKQLGEIQGLKILDAGCGNGYLSRRMAKKGAKVFGIDFSKHFIGYCKKMEKEKSLGCEFHKGSLTDMTMFESEMFDMVVSNIVMVDVQDYKTAFKEISRVLKPNGRFIWSNLHPAFGNLNQIFYRLPFDTSRNEERICLMLDRYFDSGARLISWGKTKPIWQFHRTLQEYTQALFETGFLIREIIEPKPTLENLKENPRALAFDADRIPFFIIYDCVKS
ncbi:MAG: class I SAM-dependent methyltransferase [Candidatus Heimdallarchaeota archaeon]